MPIGDMFLSHCIRPLLERVMIFPVVTVIIHKSQQVCMVSSSLPNLLLVPVVVLRVRRVKGLMIPMLMSGKRTMPV